MSADYISRYTRAEAIEDGVLVDLSGSGYCRMVQDAGICLPLAITTAAWYQVVAVPEGASGCDEKERLWDLLWLMRIRMKSSSPGCSRVVVKLSCVTPESPTAPVDSLVQVVVGPGDEGEPVLTIILMYEDFCF